MAVNSPRAVMEGPQVQGADESIAWTVDITEWGSNPTDIAVAVYDEDGNDVTEMVATGDPSAPTTTTILTPAIGSLTAGMDYRVEVQFTIGTRVLECFFILQAEE